MFAKFKRIIINIIFIIFTKGTLYLFCTKTFLLITTSKFTMVGKLLLKVRVSNDFF